VEKKFKKDLEMQKKNLKLQIFFFWQNPNFQFFVGYGEKLFKMLKKCVNNQKKLKKCQKFTKKNIFDRWERHKLTIFSRLR
jgi:hypothetical protein